LNSIDNTFKSFFFCVTEALEEIKYKPQLLDSDILSLSCLGISEKLNNFEVFAEGVN
jgi:hypothetical protein